MTLRLLLFVAVRLGEFWIFNRPPAKKKNWSCKAFEGIGGKRSFFFFFFYKTSITSIQQRWNRERPSHLRTLSSPTCEVHFRGQGSGTGIGVGVGGGPLGCATSCVSGTSPASLSLQFFFYKRGWRDLRCFFAR